MNFIDYYCNHQFSDHTYNHTLNCRKKCVRCSKEPKKQTKNKLTNLVQFHKLSRSFHFNRFESDHLTQMWAFFLRKLLLSIQPEPNEVYLNQCEKVICTNFLTFPWIELYSFPWWTLLFNCCVFSFILSSSGKECYHQYIKHLKSHEITLNKQTNNELKCYCRTGFDQIVEQR